MTEIKTEWDNRVNNKKAAAIASMMQKAQGLLGFDSYKKEREDFFLNNLTGFEYYYTQDQLNAFLIGTGNEDGGFISEILNADTLENLRSIVNSHGAGRYANNISQETPLDTKIDAAKAWIARCVWVDLQGELSELNSNMYSEQPYRNSLENEKV